jgi:hypothetical protein
MLLRNLIMAHHTPRDRRRIATSWQLCDVNYNPILDQHWNTLASKFQITLPSELRNQLSEATRIFALSASPVRTDDSITKVTTDLRVWTRRTRTLRNKVWSSRTRAGEAPDLSKLQTILKQYFVGPRNPQSTMFPLAHLAQYLEGAEAIGNYFLRKLEQPDLVTNRQTELWLVWAALIIALCRKSNIQVTHATKSNQIQPFIVALLEQLQKTLADFSNRKAAAKPASAEKQQNKFHIKAGNQNESLRKNANRALRIANDDPIDQLRTLLITWTIGWLEAEREFNIDPILLSRIRKEMSSVNQKPIQATA